MIVSELYIHPVKSCRGIAVSSANVEARGLQYDRRAMIVRPDGTFLTQREYGKMAQICPAIENDGSLSLEIGGRSYPVCFTDQRLDVRIWKSELSAIVAKDDINTVLSDFLGAPARLVYMDDHSVRRVNPDWGNSPVSFADGYPILIANSASLSALSDVAGIPLEMQQFRPNIVIHSDQPWAEDGWASVKIGDIIFDLVKPCTRCVMTTLDPISGMASRQPTMDALIKTRRSKDPRVKGVLFGWNAIARTTGLIRAGMSSQIHSDVSSS